MIARRSGQAERRLPARLLRIDGEAAHRRMVAPLEAVSSAGSWVFLWWEEAVDEEGGLAGRVAGEWLEARMTDDFAHGRELVGRVGAGDEVARADGIGDLQGRLRAVGGELGAGEAGDVVEAPGVVGQHRAGRRSQGEGGLGGDGRVERLGGAGGVRRGGQVPVGSGGQGQRGEKPGGRKEPGPGGSACGVDEMDGEG